MEFLFGALIFVLDVIAVASVLMGTSSGTRKLVWTLVIFFLPVIGLIIYFLFGRDERDAWTSRAERTY